MVAVGKLAVAAVGVGTLCYGWVEFRSPHGYSALVAKRSEVQRLKKENAAIEGEITHLEKRVTKLQTDPAALELEIRHRNGLAKPGETVYLLQDKSLRPYPVASTPAK